MGVRNNTLTQREIDRGERDTQRERERDREERETQRERERERIMPLFV